MLQQLISKIRSFNLKPVNEPARQKEVRTFRVMLFITCGVVLLLFCSLLQKDEEIKIQVSEKEVSQTDQLFQYDALLHKRLDKLQQLDEQYASFVKNNAGIKSLDSLNTVIHQEEDFFNAGIEKISQNAGSFTDEHLLQQFVKMIASFRSIISGRASFSSLRNAFASGVNDAGINGKTMNSTGTIDERDRRIWSIEAAMEKDVKTNGNDKEHSREMAALKENINDLENKVASLTAANDELKQANKRLSKEQATTKIILKNARDLQERIDVLNAEIQLTRVDCNLLKMDAVAADYDVSQKKRLISESSSILISLAGSENAAIRRKAKDKVVQLNHIAGARE